MLKRKSVSVHFGGSAALNACRRNCGGDYRQRSALTLIELLVVIAVIGLIFSAFLSAIPYGLDRARERFAVDQLHQSWKLARAISSARNEPVLWELRSVAGGTEVTIGLTGDSEEAPVSRISLTGWSVELGGNGNFLTECTVVVPPQGLTDALQLRLKRDDVTFDVLLKSVIDDEESQIVQVTVADQ